MNNSKEANKKPAGGPPLGWHGMPMLKPWVPEWFGILCYCLFPLFFQLSGGVYAGALAEMVGEEGIMKEDVQMLVYCNLAGLAIYFPLLFRTKFRFTNRQLLILSSTGVIVCNILMMLLPRMLGGYHGVAFPLMMVVAYVEGMFKLQGTFEHMSNIQMWLTPKRDFRVFFPMLHIPIMGGVMGITLITGYCAYYAHFYYTNYIIIGLMILVLLFQVVCTRPFRPTFVPFKHIDWLGMIVWSIFSVEMIWLFTYGEWADWYHSSTWNTVAGWTVATFFLGLTHAWGNPTAFVETKVFHIKKYIPLVIIGTMFEFLMGTENALEETYYEGVMHWCFMQRQVICWTQLGGVWIGCLISLWWMKYNNWNQFRLYTLGVFMMLLYHVGFYFLISRDILPETLLLPVLMRSMASSLCSATMLVLLNDMFDFQHFFQALSLFQFTHVAMTGPIGCAVYGRLMNYLLADNAVIHGPLAVGDVAHGLADGVEVLEVSIKEAYGFIIMVDILLLVASLFYKHPVRRKILHIPSWAAVGKKLRKKVK